MYGYYGIGSSFRGVPSTNPPTLQKATSRAEPTNSSSSWLPSGRPPWCPSSSWWGPPLSGVRPPRGAGVLGGNHHAGRRQAGSRLKVGIVNCRSVARPKTNLPKNPWVFHGRGRTLHSRGPDTKNPVFKGRILRAFINQKFLRRKDVVGALLGLLWLIMIMLMRLLGARQWVSTPRTTPRSHQSRSHVGAMWSKSDSSDRQSALRGHCLPQNHAFPVLTMAVHSGAHPMVGARAILPTRK